MLSNIHKHRENNSIMNLYMTNTQLQQLSAVMPSLFHPPPPKFLRMDCIVIQFNISIFKGYILKLLKPLNYQIPP